MTSWRSLPKHIRDKLGVKTPKAYAAGYREIAGRRIYFRSRYEFNYALFLQFQKGQGLIREWEHEPETFWFTKILRGVRSYLPDFRITELDGSTRYVETKAYMDQRSRTKMNRMRIYYPHINIKVVDKQWFKNNSRKLAAIIKEWE